MMKFNDFEVHLTEDGSPSLKPADSEAMHSSKGAFAETLYIYGHGLKNSPQEGNSFNILSVGLGLGYNEILWASYCLANNKNKSFLHSYESIPYLSDSFIKWINNQQTELSKTYDKILKLFSNEFKITEQEIRKFLRERYNHSFFIHPALTSINKTTLTFNCIFYDAYSSATSPELWKPEFLESFLINYPDNHCSLSTYAAISALTKALAGQGFQVKKRKGFGYKRECTFAIKKPQN